MVVTTALIHRTPGRDAIPATATRTKTGRIANTRSSRDGSLAVRTDWESEHDRVEARALSQTQRSSPACPSHHRIRGLGEAYLGHPVTGP